MILIFVAAVSAAIVVVAVAIDVVTQDLAEKQTAEAYRKFREEQEKKRVEWMKALADFHREKIEVYYKPHGSHRMGVV